MILSSQLFVNFYGKYKTEQKKLKGSLYQILKYWFLII